MFNHNYRACLHPHFCSYARFLLISSPIKNTKPRAVSLNTPVGSSVLVFELSLQEPDKPLHSNLPLS